MSFFYVIDNIKELAVDLDGSPRAYAFNHKDDDRALDKSRNAKYKMIDSNPFSKDVVVYKNGKPYVQQQGINKGMVIAMTSLRLKREAGENITRPDTYLDSEVFPYFVMADPNVFGMQLGDIAYVENKSNGMYSFAVFADSNNDNAPCTEASIKLIQNLGGPFKPKISFRSDFRFILFPLSGFGQNYPISPTTIDTIGRLMMTGRVKNHKPEDPAKLFKNKSIMKASEASKPWPGFLYETTLFANGGAYIPPLFRF